jgi:hypothetical protein
MSKLKYHYIAGAHLPKMETWQEEDHHPQLDVYFG